jgi:hypothetical protein
MERQKKCWNGLNLDAFDDNEKNIHQNQRKRPNKR